MRLAGVTLLSLWLLSILGLGGLLTLVHEAPLPAPAAVPATIRGRWTMTHGVALRCPCSRRIVDHLVARGATSDALERVLLADATPETVSALTSRGFSVEPVDAASLPAFGFDAVPGLVIHRPSGEVAYSGAHAPRRVGPLDDLALLRDARTERPIRPFAVLGSAISQALSRRVDPLSLKSLASGVLP